MTLKNKMLYVYKNSTDYSALAYKMGIEEVSLSLLTSDYLYVGYIKPQRNYFIELKTPNSVSLSLSAEMWNGTAWVNCPLIDETKGLKKSNFIYLGDEAYSSKTTTVNSVSAHWYRFKVSANTSAMVMTGLNCLFSCEDDLKNHEPSLSSFYPKGLSSHILSLVAARDFILRKINNSGFFKYRIIDPLIGTEDYVLAQNFTQFDIFDIDEIRDASVFYALHKIFSNRSDEADDVYFQKAQDYLVKFNESFALWQGRKLTLDINKDGLEDLGEQSLSISKGSFSR